MVLGAVLSASTMVGRIEAGISGYELSIGVMAGVLGFALLVGVGRWPLWCGLALGALATVAGTVTTPATMAMVVVARWERPAIVGWVAAAGAAGHAVYGLWRPLPGLSYGWWLVLDILVYAALVGWGLLIKARQELIASLQDRARRAEAEQGRRVAEARAAERTALAREMHDVLAHRLSLVATYAGALEYREDAKPAQVAKAAGVIREGVHQALGELRDVINVLRDDETADRPQPGLAEVAALVAESRSAGVAVDVDDEVADKASLPAAVGRTGYRIVQEGLTNARKHAAGLPVFVGIGGAPGAGLQIEIRNPTGHAPAEAPGTGTGLVGLTERVRLTGGRLDHEFTAAGEFRVHAWLPWPT
ncbi:sensor histidine kinase [Nocardia vermiculata]|uniref:histidine kinase n=2 Tax=Nocardia vermiculata TaxID=257274 RepID=A0A846Y5T4_9NOCA|nr:sensor histidine kinase [Nocardia vermiculata]